MIAPILSAAERRRIAKTMCPTMHRSGPEAAFNERQAGTLEYVCNDNQDELLPRVRAEKTRREIYSHCDRAPLGWEKHLA